MKKFKKNSVITSLIIFLALGFVLPMTAFAVTPPDLTLGITSGYSVYGHTGITNTGAGTRVWGNVGGNGVGTTGFTSTNVPSGTIDNTGPTGTSIEADASSVYDSLMSGTQGTPTALNLAGTHTTANGNPITPGVYTVGATTMNGAVELSGAGIYIFRSDSSATISTGSSAVMTLTNGATPCNVWWAIPASMTIGTGAQMTGNIIAKTGLISLATSAILVGRAISLGAQVTLDTNQITQPTCAATPSGGGSTQPATITVVKTVINDNGGTNVVSDFPLFVNGQNIGHQSVISGGTNVFPTSGLYPYTVTETSNANYTSTFSGDCDANGFLNLAPGNHKTCTITNNDKGTPSALPATITVVKKVINDNGGTRTVASFPLSVSGTQVVSGGTNVFPVGTYTVNEIGDSNYTRTFSGDCDANGFLNLAPGNHKTCTITNNDNAAVIVPKLPSTGLPLQSGTPWDIFITAGILMLVSTSLVLALKKRTV